MRELVKNNRYLGCIEGVYTDRLTGTACVSPDMDGGVYDNVLATRAIVAASYKNQLTPSENIVELSDRN